jgi:hypothetical protein
MGAPGLGARACDEEEDAGDEECCEGGGDQQLSPATGQAHHPHPHRHARINFLVPSLYQLIQISLHFLAFFSQSSGQSVDTHTV